MLGITKGEKWKKSNEMVFCEALKEDGKRPLEWRRGINYIRIPILSWEERHTWQVHDTTHVFSSESREQLLSSISASASRKISLACKVHERELRDEIYFFEKSSEDKDLYEIEAAAEGVNVVLVEREIADGGSGSIGKSVVGHVFRTNYEPGSDAVLLELGVPKYQLEQMVESLRKNPESTLSLLVLLEAFTYEVDDFLREPHYPQAFVVNQSSFAYLDRFELHSKAEPLARNRENDEDLEASNLEDDAIAEQPIAANQAGAAIDLTPISAALEKIATSIWVVAIAAVLISIFS